MAQETKYVTHNEDETLSVEELDRLILTKYPRPIALGYEHLLCSQSDVERAITAVKVYETGLRAVALGLIVEYLGYPKELVNDEGFNRSLYWLLKKPSLGQWLQIVRGCLQAFRGKRDLLFVEELYDLEWVSTSRGPKKRRGVWGAFDMLGHLRNEALGHSIATLDPWERIADDCLDQLRSVLARSTVRCIIFLLSCESFSTVPARSILRYPSITPRWLVTSWDIMEINADFAVSSFLRSVISLRIATTPSASPLLSAIRLALAMYIRP